jgi:hypothetical protein
MDQQTPIDPKRTIEWLNKLIMLAQWDQKLPFHTVKLLSEPQVYQHFLARVRAAATDQTQLTDNSTESTPLVLARKKLLEAVASVPALRELFGADQDPFEGAPPHHLELLAEVSDVTADSQRMVYSRNGTLMAKVEAMRQDQELDPVPLIVDSLNKFLTLIEVYKPAAGEQKSTAELLYELATSPHWYLVMASLRASRDYTRDEEPAMADALRQWNEKLSHTELRKLFLKPGHLSRAPKKLIRLAWEQRTLFDQARTSIPENVREKNPDDERKQVVDAAFLLFEAQFKTELDEIKTDLKVLGTVAIHFVKVRKFAKFDGFVYTWPAIARLGRTNYAALKFVEELLNRPHGLTDADLEAPDVRELYTLIDKDERLKRFMRLRPYFREISETELMDYRPLPPVVVSANRPGSSIAPSPDPVPPRQPPPAPSLNILLIQTLNVARAENQSPDQGITYNVEFSMQGKPITRTVTFGVEKLVEKILAAMGIVSDNDLQEILKELFRSNTGLAEDRIRRGSDELVTNVLPVSGQDSFPNILATPATAAVRVVINSLERELHYLPWEWWPASINTLLLASPDQSVIRGFKSLDEGLPEPIFAPLRLMSIIPNAPTGTRFTSDITLKGLDEVTSTLGAQYRPLVRQEATWANFRGQLESFKPQIVHFEGFLFTRYVRDRDEPLEELLTLSDSDGKEVPVEEFADMLRSSGVGLLVIGRNGVSRIYQNACATAAIRLATLGLSVIAPMRAIDDASATTFTTEFYRAFLQGNKLEPALHLARRNLASKGGDWTVFALLTDPERLQYLELVRENA